MMMMFRWAIQRSNRPLSAQVGYLPWSSRDVTHGWTTSPIITIGMIHSFSARASSSSSLLSDAPRPLDDDDDDDCGRQRPLVGIFLDLDNIVPDVRHTRLSVASWIRPIKKFANGVGKVDTIRGFGNTPTQTYIPKPKDDEIDDGDIFFQEYWSMMYSNDDDDLFPGAMVQTGYDEDDSLRCGICGARMKLSKKDRQKSGFTVEMKLERHMRQLHDKEQRKRAIKKQSRKKGLTEKEQIRFEKYKSAQVGLKRRSVNNSGKMMSVKRNDLFRILKEEGVRCTSTDDVDATLIKQAKKYIGSKSMASSSTDDDLPPVLVVASADSDFTPLLQYASSRGWTTVTLTMDAEQTKALVNESDISVVRNNSEASDEDDDPIISLNAEARTTRGVRSLQQAF